MKTEVPKYIFEDLLFDDFSTSLDDIVDINNSYEDLFKDNCNKSIKERSIRVKKIQKNYGAHLLEKFKILILAKMKIFKNLKKRR
jgi:hypothetical protein